MDILIFIPLMSYKPAKICQWVNSGCIDIDDSPACASDNFPAGADGSATFYARFSGSIDAEYENSGCILDATWPSNYGDIFFGADNCLYDMTGKYLHDFLRIQLCNEE